MTGVAVYRPGLHRLDRTLYTTVATIARSTEHLK